MKIQKKREEIPLEKLNGYVGKVIIQSSRQLKRGVSSLPGTSHHGSDYETVTEFVKVTFVGKDSYNAIIVREVGDVELHNQAFIRKTFFVPDEHELNRVREVVYNQKLQKIKDYEHVMKLIDKFLAS